MNPPKKGCLNHGGIPATDPAEGTRCQNEPSVGSRSSFFDWGMFFLVLQGLVGPCLSQNSEGLHVTGYWETAHIARPKCKATLQHTTENVILELRRPFVFVGFEGS